MITSFIFHSTGADIKEMMNQTYADNVKQGLLQEWDKLTECKKPLIAAVNGYAVSQYFTLII